MVDDLTNMLPNSPQFSPVDLDGDGRWWLHTRILHAMYQANRGSHDPNYPRHEDFHRMLKRLGRYPQLVTDDHVREQSWPEAQQRVAGTRPNTSQQKALPAPESNVQDLRIAQPKKSAAKPKKSTASKEPRQRLALSEPDRRLVRKVTDKRGKVQRRRTSLEAMYAANRYKRLVFCDTTANAYFISQLPDELSQQIHYAMLSMIARAIEEQGRKGDA